MLVRWVKHGAAEACNVQRVHNQRRCRTTAKPRYPLQVKTLLLAAFLGVQAATVGEELKCLHAHLSPHAPHTTHFGSTGC
jgi:hypothetical protein